jgi:tetratricopeptide (TPR) repeat protein
LKHFQAVAALDPRYADTQLYINRIRAQNRDIATYSQQIRSYYQKGVKLYLDGEFQRAIAIWQEILKIDPYNKLALKNIEMATKRVDFLKKYNR